MLFRVALQTSSRNLLKSQVARGGSQKKNVLVGILESNTASTSTSARFMSSFDIPLTYAPDANKGARQLKTTFDLPDPSILNSDNGNGKKAKQLTKIVATIGPTSEQLPMMEQVVSAGMKIMRLNFSHATKEEVELRKTNLALSQVRHILSRPFLWSWLVLHLLS